VGAAYLDDLDVEEETNLANEDDEAWMLMVLILMSSMMVTNHA
jgi:hypothetical protein